MENNIDLNLHHVRITLNPIKYKSKMNVGNYILNNTKHFNWFQKIMWQILLGIEIEDIRGENE